MNFELMKTKYHHDLQEDLIRNIIHTCQDYGLEGVEPEWRLIATILARIKRLPKEWFKDPNE